VRLDVGGGVPQLDSLVRVGVEAVRVRVKAKGEG